MFSIVNDKYRYILFYSAKAGSTSSRLLYLLLHGNEFTEKQREKLNHYHNLNHLHEYDPEVDYSGYTTFLITRDPYARVVSAYLDQYVFAQNKRVRQMIAENPPKGAMPDNFLEFLEYLKDVPDSERDAHFQTQAYFAYVDKVMLNPTWLSRLKARYRKQRILDLNLTSDIRDFTKFTSLVYSRVFKSDPSMWEKAEAEIAGIKKSNASFYGKADFDDAGKLSVAQLDALTFSPKPQDFYGSERARHLVEEIYAEDFRMFGYKVGDLPNKKVSTEVELIPENFDWQAYLEANADLPLNGIDNERKAVRHYLEFGRFEDRAHKK